MLRKESIDEYEGLGWFTLSIAVVVLLVTVSACKPKPTTPQATPYDTPAPAEGLYANMAIVCIADQDLASQPISACAYTKQRFDLVSATSWVRWCQSSEQCLPAELKWRRFQDVPELDWIEVCGAVKAPLAPVSGGECKGETTGTWGAMTKKNPADVAKKAEFPASAFRATPTEGDAPLDVVLEWNIPGFNATAPCTGSGHPDFVGTYGANGGRKEITLYENASFTLTCADTDQHGVLLTWRPPTLNEGGSILTDLTHYTLHYGNSVLNAAPVLSESVMVPGKAEHFILDTLKPGTWFFGMRAVNYSGRASALSNVVTQTLSTSGTTPNRFTQTINVPVATVPKPPEALTVAEPQAYTLEQTPDTLTARQFGYVATGTECDPKQSALGLFLVKRAETKPDAGETTPDVALAKCVKGEWRADPRPINEALKEQPQEVEQ